MQVEYEISSPAAATDAPAQAHTRLAREVDDGSFMEEGEGEGVSYAPAGGDESEEVEEEEGVEHDKTIDVDAEPDADADEDADIDAHKNKIKKPMKARQSMAEKQPGTTIFPMSRIKRIVKSDKDLENMGNEAVFMVAVATEYFIKHFMEEGYTKARLEKRKIVNYKDLASVVSRSEEFDFLKDVIPTPISISEALERRKQKFSADENPSLHDDESFLSAQQQALNDEDLPPLAPSTNPLFPNAIMKKPPNTHAKTAVSKPAQIPSEDQEEEQEQEVEGDQVDQERGREIEVEAEVIAASPIATASRSANPTPRVISGKYVPSANTSAAHGHSTRGAARRSLASTDVEMPISPVAGTDARRERGAGEESVFAASASEGGDTMME